jgi:hypothetical protein
VLLTQAISQACAFHSPFFGMMSVMGILRQPSNLKTQESPRALAFQGLEVGVAMTSSLHHEYRLLTLVSRSDSTLIGPPIEVES